MFIFNKGPRRVLIRRHLIKTCGTCGGSKAVIFETETAVKKSHLPELLKAGYSSPRHYIKAGLFYIVKPGLVAEASFGATRINVKASGKYAEQHLNDFEKILDLLTKK